MEKPQPTNSIREQVRFSTIVLVWRIFLLMFTIDTIFALLIVIYLGLNPPEYFHYSFIITLWFFHTLRFLILTYFVIRIVAYWAERRVYITGHHVVVRRGIVKKTEQLFELHHLKTVSMNQGWIGRRFKYGSLNCLFTASGYTENLHLSYLHDPHYYEERLATYLGEE